MYLIDQFCDQKKISDLYLMKIQISFTTRKNSRSVFNENIDWFVTRKNSGPVINEDTDLFCILEKKKFGDYQHILKSKKKNQNLQSTKECIKENSN